MSRVCAGVATWQDGPALANAVASVRDHVDEVVIVDGLIDGVDPQGLPWYSNLAGLSSLSSHVESRLWRSQAQQRTHCLEAARELGCEWLLVIDADEQLHGGQDLGRLVRAAEAMRLECLALPVDGGSRLAIRLLETASFSRYLQGAHTLEHVDGSAVALPSFQYKLQPGELWIEHRPELRPAGVRRQIRLGELQCALEQR